jgi:hypothetical protein
MDWVEIAKFLGTSTVVLGAVGFVIKSIASHFLNRDLEFLKDKIKSENDHKVLELKGEQDKALQAMRETQEARMEELRQQHNRVLQEFQAEAGERIEHVKAALQRLERLEGELLKSRDSAYGEIWELSKCVNLFGPTIPVDCFAVSRTLTDWYFSKGRLLTQNCRQIYFTIQEVLNYYNVRSICPTRPSAGVLYCGSERPVDVLIRLEAERLGIPPKGNLGTYSRTELSSYVDRFKARSDSDSGKIIDAEDAWLLLHFLMSTLRNHLGHELGWRKDLQSSMPEKDEAAPPAARGNGAPVVSSLGAQHLS